MLGEAAELNIEMKASMLPPQKHIQGLGEKICAIDPLKTSSARLSAKSDYMKAVGNKGGKTPQGAPRKSRSVKSQGSTTSN